MPGDTDMEAPTAMDMAAHAETYARITRLIKWGALACAVVAAIVIWLIV